MKTTRKFLFLLLALVLCMGLLAVGAHAAAGTCGEGVYWELTDKTLTIYGQGAMDNFSMMMTDVPWEPYGNQIETIVIQEGVTSIGDHAFSMTSLRSLTIPLSVTTYGSFCLPMNSDYPMDIYYAGTEEQFNRMPKGSGFGMEDDITFHYNAVPEAADPETEDPGTPEPEEESASPETKAGWQQSGDKWWYQNADGSYPKNDWKQIGGAWYHFDASGYMQTGWQKLGGVWYYFDGGAMVTGWKQQGGVWYCFDGSGAMSSNEWRGGFWLGASGAWTYEPRGSWHSDSTGWWFGDTSGWYAKNTWLKIDGAWYYFEASGYMKTGWMQSGGAWYYFKSSGAMACDETIDGVGTFDASGAWVG